MKCFHKWTTKKNDMRTLNFLRIVTASVVLLPWLAFMWVSNYIGQAVELAKEAWWEAGKL